MNVKIVIDFYLPVTCFMCLCGKFSRMLSVRTWYFETNIAYATYITAYQHMSI